MALLLWTVPPLLELGGVLMIYSGLPDVVEDVGFGSPTTELMVSAVLLVTIVGAVLAWRGVLGGMRLVVAAALFIAAGLTAALGLSFITGGVLAIYSEANRIVKVKSSIEVEV
ncbi:hypothetical protein [Actinoplanes solisilvae]|uniref:hypothetical protein n=1 Tax=Actinoplanes solisilvae TaxID=2486853 RepID=UPI000FD81A5E|nr:hypothetical protein [Actinoplanes solisilvae]